MMNKLIAYAQIKGETSILIVIASYLFDPTQTSVYIALALLIIADFLFGVSATIKTGDKIQSAKLRRTAIKFMIYFGMIAACRISEYALPFHMLDEVVAGYLVATELVSILENAGRMGYAVPLKILAKLQNYIGAKEDRRDQQ